MTQTRRERLREQTYQEIKDVARQQMAAEGTAALSLRAIARDMGMTAPALYRYFANRDDLITALIVDAYHALADAVEAAAAAQPRDDYTARLYAALIAYRAWALAHPVDFQLVFGNPIPGYVGPEDITVPAARRLFAVIGGILGEAMAAGALHPPAAYADLPPTVLDAVARLIDRDAYPVPPVVIYITAMGWTRIHGMIMLELFEHTQPVVGDTEAFYRFEVRDLMQSMGLPLRP